MPILPLFGTSTFGRSSNVTAQRRINLYAEKQGAADKAGMVYFPRPGLVQGFTGAPTGSSTVGGPFRGLIVLPPAAASGTTLIYAAQGNKSLLANYSGRFLDAPGFFSTSLGPVQFANVGNSALAVDGTKGYQMGTGNLDAYGFPNGATSCCALASRFIVNDPTNSGRFYWSGISDITSWPALNFATAERDSDPLRQVYTRGGELLLFGTRTLEFWAPTGDSSVFARVGGAGIDWGLPFFDTPRTIADTVLFIGQSIGGDPQVCLLNGYQVKVVSDPDIEKHLAEAFADGVTVQTSAIASAGHAWYLVHLPDTSFAFDVTTGIWGEWQSQDSRFCGLYTAAYNGRLLVTDYRDGRIYYADSNEITDGGDAVTREIISRHFFVDLERVSLAKLTLDMEHGDYTRDGQGLGCVEALVHGGLSQITAAAGATTTDSFTVELMLRLPNSALVTTQTRVLQKNAGPDWKVYRRDWGALVGTYYLAMDTSVTTCTNSRIPFIGDEEFHAAFVYDSVAQTLSGYKNGVLVGTDTGVATMNGTTATTTFYFASGTTAQVEDTGRVGLVRIWNGTRTAAEILANKTTILPTGTANMLNQWAYFPTGATSWTSNGSAATTVTYTGTSIVGRDYDGATFDTQMTIPDRGAEVMLQISKDGGHTFGNELWQELGKSGEYRKQLSWRRLGVSRDFAFRVRVSDPAKVVLINAALDVGGQ